MEIRINIFVQEIIKRKMKYKERLILIKRQEG